MKLFLDTANVDEVRQGAAMGVLGGVTTNPSLMAKERGADFRQTVIEICELAKGPVSAEVTALDTAGMVAQGREVASWHEHVVVKLPITPAGLAACRELRGEGIAVNMTLCFSVNQGLLAATVGATYVSPFLGRLDDIGHDGMALVAELVEVFRVQRFETQVLAASIRHPLHVVQAAKVGAHIATMPFKVLMQMVQHPLTDVGLERFLADWERREVPKPALA